jgi:hypothetical protein
MKLAAAMAVCSWSFTALLQAPTAQAPLHPWSGAFNRALGVACTHCHVEGNWSATGKPPFETARKMIAMVAELNKLLAPRDPIACVTCHGGQVRPERQPRPLLDEQLARWPQELAAAPEPLKITMAVYNIALGVECAHCHSADWKARDKAPMNTVPVMNQLFTVFPAYMPAGARTQCYMCHKGSTDPAR